MTIYFRLAGKQQIGLEPLTKRVDCGGDIMQDTLQRTEFFLKLDDQVDIFVRQWVAVENPVAVLQLAHGMAEHSMRYASFAQACNDQGMIVIANDHRGHGRTGEKAGLMGYFSETDGFDRVVDDLYWINGWIKEQFPQLPVFLMGHSMGSFLTRRYLQKYGDSIQGAIIMGSGGDPGVAANFGKLVARWHMRKDPTKPSTILDKLSFGSFNKGIKDPETKFDWLSRDPLAVAKYMEDPYCGMVCSSGFFYDLFTGLGLIHDPKLIERIPKDIPLLVLSGAEDPVGKNGKGVREFVSQYEQAGLTDIKTILYPGARHELLNEENRTEVIADICLWLQKQINQKT